MSGHDSTPERFEIAEGEGLCDLRGYRRGRDLETGEAVAIRLVLTPDEASVARFDYEAAIRAVLQHKYVLRYRSHGAWGEGAHYLAVECLEGESLAARLSRGRLSVEDSIQLCHRLAEVLSAAHASGIAHRRLTAESVFLVNGSPSAPRVVDFGEGAAEAARGFDPAADVHALGVLWFEALTGDKPGAITSARTAREDVPPGVDELIERMLTSFEPERLADARAVLVALSSVRHTGRWNVSASSAPPPARDPAPASSPAAPLPPPAWDPVAESGPVARAQHGARDEAASGDSGGVPALEPSAGLEHRMPSDAASDALPTLQRLFNDCVARGRSRAVLVTSDRAMEASRAAASLAYSLPARRAPEIWLMRADANSERDRLGVLSALMRQLAGIGPGDAPADKVRKLKERVKRRCARDAHLRLTGYLGQLARVPVPTQELGGACALLGDPQRLEPAMERAWVEFLAAESALQPVLLVLDAMHMIDATSLAFVETALRELADRPVMVLGLAHPRVRARFPEAFHGCDLQEIFGRTNLRPSGERVHPGAAVPAPDSRAGEDR